MFCVIDMKTGKGTQSSFNICLVHLGIFVWFLFVWFWSCFVLVPPLNAKTVKFALTVIVWQNIVWKKARQVVLVKQRDSQALLVWCFWPPKSDQCTPQRIFFHDPTKERNRRETCTLLHRDQLILTSCINSSGKCVCVISQRWDCGRPIELAAISGSHTLFALILVLVENHTHFFPFLIW